MCVKSIFKFNVELNEGGEVPKLKADNLFAPNRRGVGVFLLKKIKK